LTNPASGGTFNCSPSRGVPLPISAVDSISPAFEHTKQQLFRPFRFGQWSKLALVGLLAGEMGTGGGGGSPNFQIPATTGNTHHQFVQLPHMHAALLIPLIIALVIAIPILWLLFLYISSRMRFVLFDSIIEKNCQIGRMWRARREPAMQYFVWQIVLTLVTLAGMALIIGVPAVAAFLAGWFTAPREHIAGLILAGIAVFFAFVFWIVLTVCVHVFTKDFVVPQMALESVSAFEGWRRLLTMLQAEKGGYAGYAGMKFVLALGAAFVVTFVTIILIIVLLIPVGGLGLFSVLLAKAAGMGLSWNVFTITLAIVAGCVFLLLLFYAVSLISVPVIVFFPAYSIYFFASRYPLLANLLYPPPAPPISPIEPAPAP
jgi:hypothetical protein